MQLIGNRLSEKRRLILALWQINTPRNHLYDDMHALLKDAFIAHAQRVKSVEKDWDYQATVFATIALASHRYAFEKGEILPIPQVFDEWAEMISVLQAH